MLIQISSYYDLLVFLYHVFIMLKLNALDLNYEVRLSFRIESIQTRMGGL